MRARRSRSGTGERCFRLNILYVIRLFSQSSALSEHGVIVSEKYSFVFRTLTSTPVRDTYLESLEIQNVAYLLYSNNGDTKMVEKSLCASYDSRDYGMSCSLTRGTS